MLYAYMHVEEDLKEADKLFKETKWSFNANKINSIDPHWSVTITSSKVLPIYVCKLEFNEKGVHQKDAHCSYIK
jgi:hypothetical protein